MAPKTKTTHAWATDPAKISKSEKLLAAICFVTFFTIWISSLLSPLLFAAAVYNGQYMRALVTVLITILAYVPWEKNRTTEAGRFVFYYYMPRYFKSMSVEYEGPPIVKQALSSSTSPVLYAIHPHGAFSLGWGTLFLDPQFQHVRFCYSPVLYMSPFHRLLSRAMGKPGSASKRDMASYMRKGEDLALLVGGFEEATLTSRDHDRVYVKRRTGFVKLCLQHGVAIRPVYVFGERGLYWNVQGGWNFRLNVLNRNGLPAIVAWGNPLLPVLPDPSVDVKIVVGAPMALPQIDSPSREDVQRWHDRYTAALVKLFEDHKEDYYGQEVAKTTKLEVW